MKKTEDIALFDMDGTLCDYSKAMKRDYNSIKTPEEPEYIDFSENLPEHIENRTKLIRNQPGWWQNLEKFQPGFDILKLAQELEFEIYILTKAPRNAVNAWTEKVKWIQKEVPNARITLTQDKGIVYGKVLVDDHIPYIKKWLQNRPRGLVIMPAHPWNENFTHPNVIRYDKTNLDKIKKALELVKNRQGKDPLNLNKLQHNL